LSGLRKTSISKNLNLQKLWLSIPNRGEQQMKITNQTVENIELITTGETALFEINLVIAMEMYDAETDEGALSWLTNLLHLASIGHDIKTGAQEFMRCAITLNEARVHLCKVERITG
jgi:hypothetical protein